MGEPRYRRVIIKIGGEALAGPDGAYRRRTEQTDGGAPLPTRHHQDRRRGARRSGWRLPPSDGANRWGSPATDASSSRSAARRSPVRMAPTAVGRSKQMGEPRYRRVIIKIGGEALAGP